MVINAFEAPLDGGDGRILMQGGPGKVYRFSCSSMASSFNGKNCFRLECFIFFFPNASISKNLALNLLVTLTEYRIGNLKNKIYVYIYILKCCLKPISPQRI